VTANGTAIPPFLVARFFARGNRWTAALTVVLLGFAFVNLIFVASLFKGIVRGSNDQVIDAYVGHVTVGPPAGRRAIEGVAAELARIRRTPGVVGASAQTIVPATLQHGTVSVAREILAIDPADEETVTNIASRMIAGSFLSPDDRDHIVLGIQIAGGPDVELNGTSFRGARVGDPVLLSLGGKTRSFRVGGIFRTKFLTTDLRAFLSRRALEEMDPRARDRATTIIVRAARTGREEALIEALEAHGVAGTFGTWQDNAGIMKAVTKSFSSINALLSFVGLLIAAVTVFIVIYIDVVNRRREIGILRALGIAAWVIRATYGMKSGIYALLGLALGLTIFFAVLVPVFAAHPLSLPICDAVLVVDGKDLLLRAAALLAVAVAAGLLPAIFATRRGGILDAIAGR
jgi:putative ABC transport system permease protein